MTDDLAKQTVYEAKRRALTDAAALIATVTREVRHVGGQTMAHPLTITYRTDMHAEVVAMLERAAMVMAGDAGTFF